MALSHIRPGVLFFFSVYSVVHVGYGTVQLPVNHIFICIFLRDQLAPASFFLTSDVLELIFHEAVLEHYNHLQFPASHLHQYTGANTVNSNNSVMQRIGCGIQN